jgi:hypothetical protein
MVNEMKIKGTIRPETEKRFFLRVLNWLRCDLVGMGLDNLKVVYENETVSCLRGSTVLASSQVDLNSLATSRADFQIKVMQTQSSSCLLLSLRPECVIEFQGKRASVFKETSNPFGPIWCRGALEKGMTRVAFEIDDDVIPIETGIVATYVIAYWIILSSDGGVSSP